MQKLLMNLEHEGIGLCRTEHMFFEETVFAAMREMIVAKTVEARERALANYYQCKEKTLSVYIKK
jgi:pyruvate, orthophosphate dikinase